MSSIKTPPNITMLNTIQMEGEDIYLQDVEILGGSKDVQRIRKLFANSSVKIKVVQERPSVKDSIQWDLESNGTCTDTRDLDSTYGTLRSISVKNIYGSGEENSSGLDTEEDSRSPSSVSREVMNRRNMILVQSRIKNFGEKTLITPTRLYLREALFMKRKTHHFTFFLFNDLLVITKTRSNPDSSKPGSPRQVKFCKALDIRHLMVDSLPDSTSKGANLLKLQYSKSKTKKWKRIFSSPTKEQRDNWFGELRKLRDELIFGPNYVSSLKSMCVF